MISLYDFLALILILVFLTSYFYVVFFWGYRVSRFISSLDGANKSLNRRTNEKIKKNYSILDVFDIDGSMVCVNTTYGIYLQFAITFVIFFDETYVETNVVRGFEIYEYSSLIKDISSFDRRGFAKKLGDLSTLVGTIDTPDLGRAYVYKVNLFTYKQEICEIFRKHIKNRKIL